MIQRCRYEPLLPIERLTSAGGGPGGTRPKHVTACTPSVSTVSQVAMWLFIGGLSASADAADMTLRDLRLTLGSGPTPAHVTDDYNQDSARGQPGGSYDYSLSGAHAGEVTVGYVGGQLSRHGGLVWGAGLQSVGSTYRAPLSASGERISFSTFGPYVQVGYGYACTQGFEVDITSFGSLGGASGKWVDSHDDGSKTGQRGGYGELGLRLSATFLIAKHVVLGLQGQLSSLSGSFKIDNNDGSRSDVNITLRGGAVAGVIGVRF